MMDINTILLELFKVHGVEAVLQDEWIDFPKHNMWANGEIVREMPPDAGVTLQLDVRFAISEQQTIIESFGGTGKTRDEATGDALGNFAHNSLHVLLSAFLDSDNERSAQVEWEIGGRKSKVTVGTMGIRGMLPDANEQAVAIFDQFETRIKASHLAPGTHWARLYYAHIGGETANCEVLLNNDIWETMQEEMTAIDWPLSQGFYSVRVFIVMEVEAGKDRSPEDAVLRIADMLAANPDMDEDDVNEALIRAGFSVDIVRRAYKFTQTAWARKLLKDIGVTFSPDYLCFDAEGTVIESGLLAEERFFSAASQICHRYTNTPAFKSLAFSSSEANVLNNAMENGMKPDELLIGSAFLFLEVPTESGYATAQQTIQQHMERLHALQQ